MSRGGVKPRPVKASPSEDATPPPGTIAFLTGDLGRYTEFWASLVKTARFGIPPGTNIISMKGMDVTANWNKALELMTGEWLWIMGDDHVFDADLLPRLLVLDLDVVVPLCFTREAPFKPVVYSHNTIREEDGVEVYHTANLPPTGVHEIHACGSAGMLIRKHVLDELERPVFQTSGFHQNEDLNLCRKIREAGYKIHCCVDLRLGHIGLVGIFPLWMGDRWGTALQSGEQLIPFYPYDENDLENDLEEDPAA